MTDISDDFIFARRPTADRPLLGQTVLVVEDSRHAGETIRLMCLRGGARIRRADSLKAAARHLTSYRPTVVIVDLGLPDGSGLSLIRQLDQDTPRVPVLLALSGEPDMRQTALDSGADDFLEKPFGSVSAFHGAILSRLPVSDRPRGPRLVTDERVEPEPGALFEDLALIADLLDPTGDRGTIAYALNFARGIGRSVEDAALLSAVADVEAVMDRGAPMLSQISALAGLLQTRLSETRLAI